MTCACCDRVLGGRGDRYRYEGVLICNLCYVRLIWRPANLESSRERCRRWKAENPEKAKASPEAMRRHVATYRRRHPERARAWKAVARAIERGDLVRPDVCPSCDGTERRIEAHHDDYARPLEVRWLCSLCHRQAHKEMAA